MTHLKAHKVGVRLKDIRFKASGAPRMLASMACQPDTIDFRFWYSAESPILLSVTRFRPKVLRHFRFRLKNEISAFGRPLMNSLIIRPAKCKQAFGHKLSRHACEQEAVLAEVRQIRPGPVLWAHLIAPVINQHGKEAGG